MTNVTGCFDQLIRRGYRARAHLANGLQRNMHCGLHVWNCMGADRMLGQVSVTLRCAAGEYFVHFVLSTASGASVVAAVTGYLISRSGTPGQFKALLGCHRAASV